MNHSRFGPALCLVALLAGCGGGGSGGSLSSGGGTSTTPSPPPSSSSGCSLLERQNWVSAQMKEWYLFPETLPANLDPSPYSTVSTYLDALTATARAQGRDRYFTYLTSI